MKKVYFDHRCLVLAQNVEQAMAAGELSAMHKFSTPNELRQFVEKFAANDKLELGCVYFHNVDALWQSFAQLFCQVQAAGGLVQNTEGKYLVISRRGVTDLPKGKAEQGETAEQTALREVQEETGIEQLTIVSPIGETYHTYPLGNTTVLKTTHWFLMATTSENVLRPQAEENITDAKWVTASELKELKEKSYPSLCEVFNFVK